MRLGTVGVWWSGSWAVEERPEVDAAAELEAMGYGALWSSGGYDPGLSRRFGRLLDATDALVVASGVVSIWATSPREIATAVAELDARHPGRFLLGIGASHAAIAQGYERPYEHMVAFLDALDGEGPTVSADRRILAALGPRMLELAAGRAAGAHPYFVPVEHTATARRIMGEGPLLAPEVTVVLESDPGTARQVARTFTTGYLGLPNYANNLRRLGFGEDDLAGGGSDRLVDAVVAWGDVDAVTERVREHRDAGADHVCLQVLGGGNGLPLDSYRALSAAID